MAVWSVVKIPKARTAERQEAGMGIMGMKIQRWHTRKEFPNSLTSPRSPQGTLHTVWKPWDQPLLNLHQLWTWMLKRVFLGEASHKLTATLSVPSVEGDVKNKIFLTLQAVSWWRRKVHQRAQKSASMPISKAKRSWEENSQATQGISRDLSLKKFCRSSSLNPGASLSLNQNWPWAHFFMSSPN